MHGICNYTDFGEQLMFCYRSRTGTVTIFSASVRPHETTCSQWMNFLASLCWKVLIKHANIIQILVKIGKKYQAH
jgi:hypothetical protein